MTVIITPAYSSEEERQRNREQVIRVCVALRKELYAQRAKEKAEK